jgi:hypothetical protein
MSGEIAKDGLTLRWRQRRKTSHESGFPFWAGSPAIPSKSETGDPARHDRRRTSCRGNSHSAVHKSVRLEYQGQGY